MGTPYIGEIRMIAGNFAPVGWEFCNGQLIPIAENDALFILIGTTYGGDGEETFALPDLRGRIPVHFVSAPNSPYPLAQAAGTESVTLTVNQMPNHPHTQTATSALGNQANPQGNLLAEVTTATPYLANPDPPPSNTLNPNSISSVGGSQPHDNMMPYTGINFIISLFGVFPSQT